MKRLFKPLEAEVCQDIITADHEGMHVLAFEKITLKSKREYAAKTNDYEVVLVILAGTVNVACEAKEWKGLGNRNSVFEGKATAVYIPCQSEYAIYAERDAQIAVCKAQADEKYEPFVVTPDEVVVNERGKESWKREVHDIIGGNHSQRVQRIIVGETYNLPGSWSSYPPHKHDRENLPEEVKLEEIYHYQLHPENGVGIQLLYTEDKSIHEAHIVEHGDTFIIDQGYHPVVGFGGYQIYYLWFLGGEGERVLRPYDDPSHKWLFKD